MKLNSEFYKKKELEENSIFNKKQRIKKNSIGVGQSKILIDATILFQIKPWEYEEMKNSD